MSVPDFLIWRCAGCDAPAEGKKKPCDCATNVGVRRDASGKLEQTWWDDPPTEAEVENARLRSALEKCEGALRKARDDFAMHTREIAAVINQCAMSEKAVIELKVLMVQCDESINTRFGPPFAWQPLPAPPPPTDKGEK